MFKRIQVCCRNRIVHLQKILTPVQSIGEELVTSNGII